ncbi:concanavalin A-like lectin/glucanase domain-containing protein [Kockovaella imperatae]|uniref:Concanavalin A-like lectin/glucanase domain-containing protein n=1 Tax=Kockovaella imperatae TaxID=4999 RepID=A0A1Y1URS0_9TREE|nr:concanavalin A-like lectin/glucanase domain-containing protein [Kockovaella imperatae]ORX40204.1 concanavalin A-like lectin/glucanase domain-containing protein [Kockovaella imperatae]
MLGSYLVTWLLLQCLALGAVIPSPLSGTQYGVVDKSCPCGYVLTEYGNAYYPYYKLVTFDSLPVGPLKSANGLESLGFDISDEIYIGGTGPGNTTSVGHYYNIHIAKQSKAKDASHIMQLIVPGGQRAPGNLSGAEIHSSQAFTGGVFTAEMQMSGIVGTDQSMFTYHAADNSDDGPQDEQDIEILAAYLFKAGKNGTPPGVELTNWDPTDPENEKHSDTIVPFPQDPTKSFHNYTIAWLNQTTQYYFDKTLLKSPKGYYSYHPSYLYLNNWSDADPEFTLGPPKKTVIQQVKSISMYYHTAAQPGILAGCSMNQACLV